MSGPRAVQTFIRTFGYLAPPIKFECLLPAETYLLSFPRLAGKVRVIKLSLDNSLSGRPELHCEAQLSIPAPRNLQLDRTYHLLSVLVST